MKTKISDVRVVCKDIRTITDEQWKTLRRNIGGEPKLGCSDTARVEAIYNAAKEPYPWSTPQALGRELRAAMKGVLLDQNPTNAMDWGHKMEAPIALAWAAQNPDWQLVATHTLYESTRYPWMRGNLDYFVQHKSTGELGVLEIKHTSCYNNKFISAMRAGKVPEYYAWQVQAEMTLVHLEKAFLCLGWSKMEEGCKVEGIAWAELTSDPEKEAFMVKAEKEFVQSVIDGSPVLATITPKLAEELKAQWVEYLPGVATLKEESLSDMIMFEALEDEEKELSDRLSSVQAERDIVADRIFRAGGMRQAAELVHEDQRYTLEMTFTKSTKVKEEEVKAAYPEVWEAARSFTSTNFKTAAKDHGLTKEDVKRFIAEETKPKGFTLQKNPYIKP